MLVDPEHKEFKRLKRERRGVKMMSASFLIIGGMLFVTFLLAYLDPDATINVNDVPTTSSKAKLQAVIFSSFFVLVGVAGLLLPKRPLNRMLIARASLMPSTGENLLQKQYRLMSDHPVIFCSFFAVFMLFATSRDFLEKIDGGESFSSAIPEFLFVLGFGTAFFYFGFKFMAWMMLKMGGHSLRGSQSDS
jgi:hypothetical protein